MKSDKLQVPIAAVDDSNPSSENLNISMEFEISRGVNPQKRATFKNTSIEKSSIKPKLVFNQDMALHS
jgi:hypothetical protein